MSGVRWSRQNPYHDADILRWVAGERVRDLVRSCTTVVDTSFAYRNEVSTYSSSVVPMSISIGRLEDIVYHIKELPKLEDGVKLNDHLWVRVTFSDWDKGCVDGYRLYANGLSPNQELLNECIGSEICEDIPIDGLPACIATPLHMRRVRGRDSESVYMHNNRTVWMTDLAVTASDLSEITKRDKWAYQPQGEKICKELTNLLHQLDHT